MADNLPMYFARSLEPSVVAASVQFPVVLLTGARQVGKTTLLRKLCGPERTYVTLDDPLLLSLAKNDPALFLQRFQPPLLIDEVQYAPELLPHIKMLADGSRGRGLVWMSGSQQFHLMQGVTESLAGRAAILRLLGMSRLELAGKGPANRPFTPGQIWAASEHSEAVDLRTLFREIWRGSLPGLALDDTADRDLFWSSYVQTYLQRDVRALSKAGDEMSFLRFLRVAASRTGQLLNIADLARDADVSPNAAKARMSILQASGIVYLLEPYHSNLTKRLVKAPKLYFLDTGLCSYLTGWSSPETLEAGAMSGPIFETWVVAELLKSYIHAGKEPPFFYFRDKDAREIDLLILADGVLQPVEIKKTGSPSLSDVRAFASLNRLGLPIGAGSLVCMVEQPVPLSQNVTVIPASWI